MALILVLLFIVLPIAEIYVIIKVGEAIGVWATIGLLILDGFLGAAIVRHQGRAAWRRFNEALAAGRVPAREAFDGAMVIVGGAFLLAPGFISDAIGLLLLLPLTRNLFRGIATKLALGRAAFAVRGVRWGSRAHESYRDARRPGSADPQRSYDYEGSAREVPDTERELPRPRTDGGS
jgi:UPF0716 protein FxsA